MTLRLHAIPSALIVMASLLAGGPLAHASGSGKPPAPKSGPAKPEPQFPTRVNWLLSDLNGKVPADTPTLSVDEALRASGFGGCNTYSAALYPIPGQRLAMGPVALTKKACDPARAALEHTFIGALHSGPTWEMVGDNLVIKAGATTLRFRRGL